MNRGTPAVHLTFQQPSTLRTQGTCFTDVQNLLRSPSCHVGITATSQPTTAATRCRVSGSDAAEKHSPPHCNAAIWAPPSHWNCSCQSHQWPSLPPNSMLNSKSSFHSISRQHLTLLNAAPLKHFLYLACQTLLSWSPFTSLLLLLSLHIWLLL